VDVGLLAVHSLLLLILIAAAVTDIRSGKVYNVLTYSAVLAGLALNATVGIGLSAALLGLATGFVPMFVIYLAGGLGGGDVKLMAAVGAFLGAYPTLFALLYTCLIGGILAFTVLLWKEGFTGAWMRVRHKTAAAAPRFPFAVAIVLGTAWVLVEGHLGMSALDALTRGSA